MLLEENLRRRRKTPAILTLYISEFLSVMRRTASLAVLRGLPKASAAVIMAASMAPMPVPAMMSKKSAM
ncbi:hypothetical protein Lalb_Chr21g0306451 [Lupinus albus]|uniref:Uncharacterized protein n=1 Tax=Lupinus albus TaxID=3870 RepID=A0A6A4NB39_LUPAL|nr:hypothetical protein Lalb_Chr21g0306451 [Lupinus albus]